MKAAARRPPRDAPLPRAEEIARLPVVAIVGRPNTGKSTLFNRLTRSRRALVASTPGVTRDRNVGVADWSGRRFLVVDTGGFEADEHEEMSRQVRSQALLAADQADAMVLVVDGRAGLNPLDRALFERLRPLRKPLFVAVNKLDTPKHEDLQSDFFALGVDPLYPVSAEHGGGVGELMDAVLSSLPVPEPTDEPAEPPTAVAIIGRPNVGKSSLLNRLVGYDRAIVNPVPGTTRDALDTPVSRGQRAYLLVDTAGVRRRPKVSEHLERASVVRALRALERAEIGVLIVDAVEGMTEQDARIAGYATERGRALVLVVNKWDAVPAGSSQARFAAEIDRRYPSLAEAPKLFLSALTGRNVQRIWSLIDAVAASHRLRIPTGRLNQALGRAVEQQAPAMVKGKRPRFFYAAQVAVAPPTIAIFCSAPDRVAANYQRYLNNQLRAAFGLQGTPLRLRFRSRREKAK